MGNRNDCVNMSVKDYLLNQISVFTGQTIDVIDVDSPFFSIGLKTSDLISLISEISKVKKFKLPSTLGFDYPTIRTLSEYIESLESCYDEKMVIKRVSSDNKIEENTLGNAADNSIAVIGMGCRFPGGCNSPDEFWQLLEDGGDAISLVPESRWDIEKFYDEDPMKSCKMNTKWGGFLNSIDEFDPLFFGISPREAKSIDPQQRLLLEVSWEAFEDAGIIPSSLKGGDCGVFMGISGSEYERLLFRNHENLNLYCGTGTHSALASNRVSYNLGLRGPSISVDTACSSSLVAVHLACESLKKQECGVAIAGGVNLILSPERNIILSKSRLLSPEGRCKTFDSKANGYVRSEGCGVAVLKKYSKALSDGDRIYGLIRSTDINHDGESNGLTSPNGSTQEMLIRNSLRKAGVVPSQISYSEIHGTGTSVGDPIEVNAISGVLGENREKNNPLILGSVKTNLGHLEPASGVASLFKVLLSLKHKMIPAQLNFEKINSLISFDGVPVIIPTENIEWKSSGTKRIATVSGFGFGGANAHSVIEEFCGNNLKAETKKSEDFLLTFSAKDEKALREKALLYQAFLEANSETDMENFCYTANAHRSDFLFKASIIGKNLEDIIQSLSFFVKNKNHPEIIIGKSKSDREPVFSFTSDGYESYNLWSLLYKNQSIFRNEIDSCNDGFEKETGISLSFACKEVGIEQDGNTDSVLFCLKYCFAKMCISMGITPAAVTGKGIGEYAAACIAGVFSFEDGLKLVRAREAFIKNGLPSLFNDKDGSDKVSNTSFLNKFYPFDSLLMESDLLDFEKIVSNVEYSIPKLQYISNLTGELIEPHELCSPEYWLKQFFLPAEFEPIEEIKDEVKNRFLFEIEPSFFLSETIGSLPDKRDDKNIAEPEGTMSMFYLQSWILGKLYTHGCKIDWKEVYIGANRKIISIPTYPFQRQKYWFDNNEEQKVMKPQLITDEPSEFHPSMGNRIKSCLKNIIYEYKCSTNSCFLNEHRVYGYAVMSGGTIVSMLSHLIDDLFGYNIFELENIFLREALYVPDDIELVLQIVFTKDGSDKGFFNFFSTIADKNEVDADWSMHLEGNVKKVKDLTGFSNETDFITELIKENYQELIYGEKFYEKISSCSVKLGSHFKWIDKIWKKDDEVLAELRIADDKENNNYLPAGLIDSCNQLLFSFIEIDKEHAYMFLGFESFRFYGNFTGKLFCHMKLNADSCETDFIIGDYKIWNQNKELVGECRGLHLKQAPYGIFQKNISLNVGFSKKIKKETRQKIEIPSCDISILEKINKDDDIGKSKFISDEIAEFASEIMGIDTSISIDYEVPLMEMGLDSLMAIELRNRFKSAFGVSISLVEFIKRPSISMLTFLVLDKLNLDSNVKFEEESLPLAVSDPDNRLEPFPLTDIQHAYWVGRGGSLELGDVSCHVYAEVDVKDLDINKLENAVVKLMNRHEMLRAVFLDDGQQCIKEEVEEYKVKKHELIGLDSEIVEKSILQLRDKMSHQTLPSETGPLFEIQASIFADGISRLHMSFDLLIGDGWSFNILINDLCQYYLEPESNFPDIDLSFRDYVLLEKSLTDSGLYLESKNYWKERAKKLPAGPELPLGQKPDKIKNHKFIRFQSSMESEKWKTLKLFGAEAGLTPSGILIAAFSEVLAYWSKTSDFTINLTMFNRLPVHEHVDKIVGDFTTLTLLEINHDNESVFQKRALKIQERLWEDLEHRYISGVEVLREMAKERSHGSNLSFPIVFTSLLPYSGKSENSTILSLPENLSVDMVYCISQTPQVWLDHQVFENNGSLIFNWDIVDGLFPENMLEDMFDVYCKLINLLAEDKKTWSKKSLGFLTRTPLIQTLLTDSRETLVYPNYLLHSLFEKQVLKNAEKDAIVTTSERLTYKELDEISNGIASLLIEEKITAGKLVGVVMERGWEQVAGALGILKSGGAYLPLDSSIPESRLELILKDADVDIVLTQPDLENKIYWPENIKVVSINKNLAIESLPENFENKSYANDLAYVIYTSGSTGKPKGVMIDHAGALNTIADINKRFDVTSNDKVISLAAMNFDLSVYDYFGVLGAGGTIVIPDHEKANHPDHWLELMEMEKITIWNSVPQLMQMLTDYLPSKPEFNSKNLRLVMMSGDWIPLNLPGKIRENFNAPQVISLGGATEASIWSILYPIEKVDENWKSIPYGRAMLNQKVMILNKSLDPCPVWVTGDIYIGGKGLAKGYLNDDEKTNASFITHPETGERLYRTGDLGRSLPDGNIEFLGRDDFQVKILGHRIELGEIEKTLELFPGVNQAVVSTAKDGNGKDQLIGYLVPKKEDNHDYSVDSIENDYEKLSKAGDDNKSLITDPLKRLEFKLERLGRKKYDEKDPYINLPAPVIDENLINEYSGRVSLRHFENETVNIEKFYGLLGHLSGIKIKDYPFPKYKYGSAGGLYPVQTYLYIKEKRVGRLAKGIYYFDPLESKLISLCQSGIENDFISGNNKKIFEESAFSIFLVAKFDAIEPVYGNKSRDFALIEAGLIAQLLESSCFQYGLGLCQIGVVDFEKIKDKFQLNKNHECLLTLFGGKVKKDKTWTFINEAPDNYLEKLKNENINTNFTREVKAFIQDKLPSYMVPNNYIIIDKIPLGSNGKVDLKVLPEPGESNIKRGDDLVLAENATEETLTLIWKEVLKKDELSVLDNFFELGGDSLLALQLLNKIRKKFNIEMAIGKLFELPDIKSLGKFLNKAAEKEEDDFKKSFELPTIEIDLKNRFESFPLTDIQEAYWIGRKGDFDLGNTSIHFYMEIENRNFDVKELNNAWNKVIKRHDMMRAVVTEDGYQRILDEVPYYEFQTNDFVGLDDDYIENQLDNIRQEMSHQAFSAEKWPFFDIRVSKINESNHRLHISFDALTVDALSFFLVIKNWHEFYQNPKKEFAPLELSFRDYVLAEKKITGSILYERDKKYWIDKLEDLPSAPEIPMVKDPSSITRPRFKRRNYIVDSKIWSKIKKITSEKGLTPAGILISAYCDVLNLWSKNSEFTINLTLFNRLPMHKEVNEIVGDFTSLTMLSVDRSVKDESFFERSIKLQKQLWKDLEHRSFSGIELQRELARKRQDYKKSAMSVVFTSALNMESADGDRLGFKKLGDWIYGVSQTPQVWLDHQVYEQDGDLILIWDAIDELFPKGLLDDMFEAYHCIIENLGMNEYQWDGSNLPKIPDTQVNKRSEVNNTDFIIEDKMLHELFYEKFIEYPENTAVISTGRNMTYKELYKESSALSLELNRLDVKNNQLIGIIMEKGAEQIISVLGILNAGAAYLPIDAGLPKERILNILKDGDVKIILTQSWIKGPETMTDDFEVICVDELEIEENTEDWNFKSNNSKNLAYVIYTSGSTGQPKGVMLDHKGPVNTVLDINNRFDIGSADKALALSALNFDLSVYDVFGILGAGGAIILPDADKTKDPKHWFELIEKEHVTVWNSVPALLEMFVEYIEGNEKQVSGLIKNFVLSGDWIPLNLPEKIKKIYPTSRIQALGGATEASIWSNIFEVDTIKKDWKSIPYGRPLTNQRYHILNKLMEDCPDLVPGDLYISGDGLASGYWKDMEKTNNSFLIHPYTGEKIYKTGDLARYLTDGNIEFLGREDNQVKINGFRVELGEIEFAADSYPKVNKTISVLKEDNSGKPHILLYVLPEKNIEEFSMDNLKKYLKTKLPSYMCPSFFGIVDSFPINSNGKIDRKKLPDLISGLLEEEKNSFALPEGQLEKEIVKIFKKITNIDKVSVLDSFFDLGANSMDLVRFQTGLKKEMNIIVNVADFFEYPTIRSISEFLSSNTKEESFKKQADKKAEARISKRKRRKKVTH